MRFQVPQFIDVEDKIFGPFTFKQFVYIAGGAGIAFILWRLLPHFVAIIFIAPIGMLAAALAFYKVNNKPFIHIVEAYIRYTLGSKLYIWKKDPAHTKKEEKPLETAAELPSYVPRLSDSKLKDISWSLDVLDVNKK